MLWVRSSRSGKKGEPTAGDRTLVMDPTQTFGIKQNSSDLDAMIYHGASSRSPSCLSRRHTAT